MNIKNIVMGVAIGSLILAAAAPAFAGEAVYWKNLGGHTFYDVNSMIAEKGNIGFMVKDTKNNVTFPAVIDCAAHTLTAQDSDTGEFYESDITDRTSPAWKMIQIYCN